MFVSSWTTRRSLLVGIAATYVIGGAAIGPVLRAQAPSRPDIPVFRASTRLVQVDVIVVDRNRRPVRDLQLSDFEIKQGGKTQTLQFAEFVDGRTAAASTRAGSGVEPDVAVVPARDRSEQTHAGRKLVFFVDSGFMRPDELYRAQER